MLTVLEALPEGFLELPPDELHRALPGPTLIHLAGEREPPVVAAMLLHGNEPAGLFAVQHLLRQYAGRPLPRSLVLVVGNVAAARARRRRLDDQPDYNRVWGPGELPEHAMAAAFLSELKQRGPLLAVDVHNNTGRNPHYALAPCLDGATLQLAARFAPKVIWAPSPRTTFAAAVSELCPAVTLECGTPWDAAGYARAAEMLDGLLSLDGPLPTAWPNGVDLHESVAVVRVPSEVDFGFEEERDLALRRDLDESNFEMLPPGYELARVKRGSNARLSAYDDDGHDVTAEYFAVDGERLVTAQSLVPAMFSLDARVIRQDCLGYVLLRRSADELAARAAAPPR